MKQKKLVLFAFCIFLISLIYFLATFTSSPGHLEEHENWLNDMGEGFGVVSLWALLIIYGRTALNLVLKKGNILQRFIPDELFDPTMSIGKKILYFLNRSHAFVGVCAIATIFLHSFMMKVAHPNIFFTLILVLLLWQAAFGFFITFRHPVKLLRKYSYLVHAQLFSGIMISIFALFGHLLVSN